MNKLKGVAKKTKEVLSANSALPVTVEALYKDKDLRAGSISRSTFETLSGPLLKRAMTPINQAIDTAKAYLSHRATTAAAGEGKKSKDTPPPQLVEVPFTIANISAVELLGGGVRIPRLQSDMKAYMSTLATASAGGAGGDVYVPEVGQHMNGDESMTLGAAFFAANMSTQFKSGRKIGMTDYNPWPVSAHLSAEKGSRRTVKTSSTSATAGADVDAKKESGGFLSRMVGSLMGGGSASGSDGDNDDEEVAGGGADDNNDNDGGWQKSLQLFKTFGKRNSKKVVTVAHDRDISLSLKYEDIIAGAGDMTIPVGTDPLVGEYQITGITAFAEEVAKASVAGGGEVVIPKVYLTFTLDAGGVISLVKGEAQAEVVVAVKEKKDKKDKKEKGGDDKEKDEKTEEAESSNGSEEDGNEESNDAEDNTTNSDKEKEDESTTKKSKVNKKNSNKSQKEKKKLMKRALTIKEISKNLKPVPYTPETLVESKSRMAELIRRDEEKKEKETAKNTLESYFYSVRHRLSDAVEANINAKQGLSDEEVQKLSDAQLLMYVSTESERETVTGKIGEMEEWLMFDGDDASTAEYKDRLRQLKSSVEPIFTRATEAKTRPAAVNKALDALTNYEKTLEEWCISSRPWLLTVAADEVASTRAAIATKRTWISDKVNEQKGVLPFDSPVVTVKDMKEAVQSIQSMMDKLKKKQKPAPPKEDKKVEEKEEEEKESKEEAKEGDSADEEEAGSEEQESSSSSSSQQKPESDEFEDAGEEEEESAKTDL